MTNQKTITLLVTTFQGLHEAIEKALAYLSLQQYQVVILKIRFIHRSYNDRSFLNNDLIIKDK